MKRYRAIAEYYDFEIERMAWLKRDVPFFLKHVGKRPQQILELACGTGRAAIPIAQAGHRVVGVDYAPDMLAIARRKRDSVGLADGQLRLLRRDVLKLNLKEKFDWICIFFNTFLGFTTLAAQDRALRAVRDHLKPGGRFWLDIFHPNLSMLAEPRSVDTDPSMFYVPALERTVYMTADVDRDPSKQLLRVTFKYRWFDGRGIEHRERTRFDMTSIFPRELHLLLERNGFRIRGLWGSYDGKPLSANSPRMIAMCQAMA